MTDLVEGNAWIAGIYQLETDDPVMGGAEGIDNLQAKQLASRTQYLLAQVLLRATLASPTFTGDPRAPTPAADDNDTSIATTAFVKTAIANLVAASPAALDTLNELAAALGNDPNFATTITNALALKAPLASPALTGTPTAPTAAAGTNTTQLATTAFVAALGALKANTASPAFTGNPTAPTPASGDNDTSIATTAFVQAAIADLVAASPAALDTLNELAAALGNDPNFATTITNALALKAALASPAFTGTPTAPTAAPGTNTTQLATTAFAAALGALKANIASPTFTGTPAAPTAAAGTNTTQLATTAFVQNEIAALSNTGDYKGSVRLASTSNVAAISGLLTIDGVILVAGNRVLLKDQTTASQNGIYVAAAGAWSRASDADTGSEFNGGAIISVEEGTANADTNWQVTNDGAVTIGTTGLTFQQVGGVADATTATKGKVLLAKSSSFTGTGSTTDVPPVAAIIAGLLGAGGNSANDYVTIPYRDKTDGTLKKLIVQWFSGTPRTAEGSYTDTFPIAFPNACLKCFTSASLASSSPSADTSFQVIGSPTLTTVTYQVQQNPANSISVTPLILAIGY